MSLEDRGYLSDTEIVDPMKQCSQCTKPTNYPFQVQGPTVKLTKKKHLISCGGYNGTYSRNCYDYDLTSSSWNVMESMMSRGRRNAASVSIDKTKVWITGGYNYPEGDLKSTEIFDVETKTFTNGPDLPESSTHHCMTNYNDSHIFIGGIGIGSNRCFLVDTTKDPYKIQELPKLSEQRFGAGCGVIQSDLTSNNQLQNNKEEKSGLNKVINVAGGGYPARSDSELLVVGDNGWREGPMLPRGFWLGGSTTINENSILLVGGVDENGNICNDILQLNGDTMEYETLPGTLETPRSSFGMAVLTEDC